MNYFCIAIYTSYIHIKYFITFILIIRLYHNFTHTYSTLECNIIFKISSPIYIVFVINSARKQSNTFASDCISPNNSLQELMDDCKNPMNSVQKIASRYACGTRGIRRKISGYFNPYGNSCVSCYTLNSRHPCHAKYS